ncbi:hypothetical protein HFO91_30495 [Rhizobium leguminosarum]|uniref:hypothetical protein n=1 Tax=Rhizobium leguminosarum TaxID=384 RepID=UPI001C9389D2|nr:hypothetical protein [Rhizobium leguminosarum]MBY5453910.1 hypothetical protein [Rhizobium leguminosarum]
MKSHARLVLAAAFATAVFAVADISLAQSTQTPADVDVSKYYVSERAYNQAARVYGFLHGQHLVLQTMKKQYPAYDPELTEIEAIFDAEYGWPQPKAEAILRTMGAEAFKKMNKEYVAPVEKLAKRKFSQQEVAAYAVEMQDRTKGTIKLPDILQNLRWLQYAGRPAREMNDRKVVRFSSSNHPKAAGVDVALSAPASWLQSEGDRPHVVQQWLSQNGSGDMSVSLLIKADNRLKGGLQEADIAEMKADDGKGFVGDNDTVLETKFVHIDGAPTIRIDFVGTRDSAVGEITSFTRSYIIIQPGALVELACRVGRMKTQKDISEKRFPVLQDLCEQVAITLSIANRYP